MATHYDGLITLKKGAKYLIYFGVPLLIGTLTKFYPEVLSMSVGTILTMAHNYIKNK